ncbi:MAG: bifunctional riboflavin kinase/FAD synthetase [Akkermansiaceae bacterium]|nr:bifunctional riboflavin kinase/FAD synthetase [Akkermansiaceae bacterium]
MVRLIENLNDLRLIDRPLHLALGVFDGVHIGHQAVIRSAVDAAKLDGGVAGVLTFDPHPIRVLAPKVAPQRILASLNHKRELLAGLGVDVLVVIAFTEEFANCEALDFLTSLKDASPRLKTLAIGEDWKFGKQRQGDIALLEEFGGKNGIRIISTEAVMVDGERVSSTRVRQAIRDGNMKAAHAMLGREYTVLGTVVEGRQLGRTIGFPTANLRVHNEQLPTDGVWAVEATLENGEVVCGAGNLGVRPTVEGEGARRMLEVHLLDYSGDLYGSEMEVRFLKYVREEQKFDSIDALMAQIRADVAFCRNHCRS